MLFYFDTVIIKCVPFKNRKQRFKKTTQKKKQDNLRNYKNIFIGKIHIKTSTIKLPKATL